MKSSSEQSPSVGTPQGNTSASECQVIFEGTTRTIPLSQGKVAIVDEADYDYLNQYKWYAKKGTRCYYAARSIQRSSSKRRDMFMHRDILNAPDGLEVDHINTHGLDNRRSNLRLCTHSQNGKHQRVRYGNKTGFKGVVFVTHRPRNPYHARIGTNYKNIHVGCYKTAEHAARAYDRAALKVHGEFALTNEMLGLLPKRPHPTTDKQREAVDISSLNSPARPRATAQAGRG